VSQSIGDAVGNALTNGITGLIEGTTTAKEVFASFLKDIGQILMQEAAKMIATYIAIGIAKQFAGLFGGGSAGGAKPPLPGSFPLMAAKGAYFDGGTAYFAKGGVVSSPTLFQFADGGAMQTGLMGEAGPEAIMPLKRGPDGKLGVAAQLDGAMSRYRRTPGAVGAVDGGTTEAGGVGGTASMAPIDVRYSVERINNVDYVTADQFRAGMAQAAQQGAIQGERRAMRSLKGSAATRRSVGI
jgi:phage-related minor tail protein